MPRKSAAAQLIPTVDGRPTRVKPAPGMSPPAERLFGEITSSVDATHFVRSEVPLLAQFCEQGALAELAARKLATGGPVVGGKPSPWLFVAEKAWRACQALAPKLRLCPSSRIDGRAADRTTKKPGPVDIDAILREFDR